MNADIDFQINSFTPFISLSSGGEGQGEGEYQENVKLSNRHRSEVFMKFIMSSVMDFWNLSMKMPYILS